VIQAKGWGSRSSGPPSRSWSGSSWCAERWAARRRRLVVSVSSAVYSVPPPSGPLLTCLRRSCPAGGHLRRPRSRGIGASALVRCNLLISGLGGIVAPFLGIKVPISCSAMFPVHRPGSGRLGGLSARRRGRRRVEAGAVDAALAKGWSHAHGTPVLVCLNGGWGGRQLVAEALSWSRRTGRSLAFVYVLPVEAAGRRQVRVARRALRDAREVAVGHGSPVGETVVRAASVPDGLRMACDAMNAEVALALRDEPRRVELEAHGVPLLHITW
jgi:nucleotide-binding universal stress UspA family protein